MTTQLYRKSSKNLLATAELDLVTRRVYTAINGDTSLSVIAQSAKVSIPVLWQSIAKLKRLGLIEEGTGEAGTMGLKFANKIQGELSNAIGPMSNVVIQKVVKLMKFTWPNVPAENAREFIYRLLIHIPNEDSRNQFKMTMLNEL